MNILSVTNALKGIKLKELDDEFQIELMRLISPCLPVDISVNADSTGDDIRNILDNSLDVSTRHTILGLSVFPEQATIVRFYNNVEKIQDAKERELEYDDAIKGNFLANLALFEIIAVLLAAALYSITEQFRGKIPESKILASLDIIISNLSNLN